MAAIVAKSVYPGGPNATRGLATLIDGDPSGRTERVVYPSGRTVVVRGAGGGGEEVVVYDRHVAAVTCVRFGKTGDVVVSGDAAGHLRVWELIEQDSGLGVRDLGAWEVMLGSVRCVALGGGFAVAGGETRGGFVKVVKLKGGAVVGCGGHGKSVLGCDVDLELKGGIITASEDMTVGWFEGPPVTPMGDKRFMKVHQNFVNDVRFSPVGEMFATASSDRKACLFDGKTKEVAQTLEGHQGSVTSVAWSADGKELVTSSNDKTVRVWNVEDGQCLNTIVYGKDLGDMQVGCCIIHRTSQIVSASLRGDISIADKGATEPKSILRGHSKQIVGLAVVKGKAYSADYLGHLVEWDVRSGATPRAFSGTGPTSVCAIAANDNEVATFGKDGKVFIINTKSLTFERPVVVKGGGVDICMPVHQSDRFSAIAINESRLAAISVGGRSISAELRFHRSDTGTCVAIRRDGSLIAVGLEVSGGEGQVRFFRLSGRRFEQEGDTIRTRSPPNRLGFSPNGESVAVGERSKRVNLYTTTGIRIEGGGVGHTARVDALCWSRDGNRIATGSMDGSLAVWTFDSDDYPVTLTTGHRHGVTGISFLDNKTFITSGGDSCLRTWVC